MSFIIFIVIFIIIIRSTNKSKQNRMKSDNYSDTMPDKYNRNSVNLNLQNQPQKPTRAEQYLKDHPYATKQQRMSPPSGKGDVHNHAYQHKVEPIDSIDVSEDEDSTIAQLMEKREEKNERQEREDRMHDYKDRHAAKNGDREDNVSGNERVIVCSYCGARNIISRSSRQRYTCYFCREEIR